MENPPKRKRHLVVVNIPIEHHKVLRILGAQRNIQIKEMATEAIEDYFTKTIGSDWRTRTMGIN